MRAIVSGMTSLVQYLDALKQQMIHLDRCVHCGKADPWCHGKYPRKSDREQDLNPIWILRFLCPGCRRTCSVLPECIPPRRWYLWAIQQIALLACMTGASLRQVSHPLGMSRSTIRRWLASLKSRHQEFSDALKSIRSSLGYGVDLPSFWEKCFEQMPLSKAMYLLNELKVMIP